MLSLERAAVARHAVRRLDLDEQLFDAVIHAAPEDSQGLLRRLEDVDPRNGSLRTPLHLAVRLGRANWVRALLSLGADAGAVDKEGLTVLDAAEAMSGMLPWNENHKRIWRLVSQAAIEMPAPRRPGDRGGRRCRGSSTQSRRETLENIVGDLVLVAAGLSKEMLSFQGSVNNLRSEAMSLADALSPQLVLSPPGGSSIEENLASPLQEALGFGERQLNPGLESWRDVLSAGGTVDLTGNKLGQNGVAMQTSALGELIDDVRVASEAKDRLLERLDVSVALLEGHWLPLVASARKVCARVKEVEGELEALKKSEILENSRRASTIRPALGDETHEKCVNSMLEKTFILDPDDGKVSRLRGLYDLLYSSNRFAASLMEFLRPHSHPRIVADLESASIHRMMCRFKDVDGEERMGKDSRTFADVVNLVVCFGGRKGWFERAECVLHPLAASLSRMALHLAFGNEGRPYAVGDGDSELEYKEILEEAEQQRREACEDSPAYDRNIVAALDRKTRKGREVDLISSVPAIVTLHGSMHGMLTLRRQIPRLLEYYEDHVLATFSRESQVGRTPK